MKRFVVSCCIFVLLLLVAVIGTTFVLPDNHICNSMLGAQRLKLTHLSQISGPRIIFVGGSNVGQGFDSAVVEKAFNRPVKNMGLHAGLGLIYQLKAIQDLVHEGDLVVVTPEYDMFSGYCWGDDELVAMITAIMPEHCSLLTFQHWSHLLDKIPRYACRKLKRVITLFEPLHTPVAYNEKGDRIAPLGSKRVPFQSCMSTVGEESYDDSAIPYIVDFVKGCHWKNAGVVFMPPAFEHTSYMHMRELISRIDKELKVIKVPFVVPPEVFAFDDEMFLDTPYHLNAQGIPLRMKRVVNALNKHVTAIPVGQSVSGP